MSRKREIWKTSAWTFESAMKAAGVGGLLLASCAPGREPMPFFEGDMCVSCCARLADEDWTTCGKCRVPASWWVAPWAPRPDVSRVDLSLRLHVADRLDDLQQVPPAAQHPRGGRRGVRDRPRRGGALKTYKVKEIFSTLQGEGYHAGRAAVFVRFAGCNLWSGREKDRADGPGVCSRWCDTDFRGGRSMTALEIRDAIERLWVGTDEPFVVLTGGEPLLQVDGDLLETICWSGSCGEFGKYIAIETNGTVGAIDVTSQQRIDHITVSPKKGGDLVLNFGQEFRVAWPQWSLEEMEAFEKLDFEHFYVSPINGSKRETNHENLASAVEFCRTHPCWRLSLQLHKIGGFR